MESLFYFFHRLRCNYQVICIQHVTGHSLVALLCSFLHYQIEEERAQCWSLVDSNRDAKSIRQPTCSSNTWFRIIIESQDQSHKLIRDHVLPQCTPQGPSGHSVKGLFKIHEHMVETLNLFNILMLYLPEDKYCICGCYWHWQNCSACFLGSFPTPSYCAPEVSGLYISHTVEDLCFLCKGGL